MSGVNVVVEDPAGHPVCLHGPMLLFERRSNGNQFYACSSCRSRKECAAYARKDSKFEAEKMSLLRQRLEQRCKLVLSHHSYDRYKTIVNLPSSERGYCHTCSSFVSHVNTDKHKTHDVTWNLTNKQLTAPTQILKPRESSVEQAQYLFTATTTQFIVSLLQCIGVTHVTCVGSPRIHENISKTRANMSSLLMDIDSRYLDFFPPSQFCWYNMFVHHFYSSDNSSYHAHLSSAMPGKLAIVTDPPFGGKVSALSWFITKIQEDWNRIHKHPGKIAVFFVFPYFMEPQIKESFPDWNMLDYKVEYENHSHFSSGPRAPQRGSPVRLFTNMSPSLLPLPADEGYRHCTVCERWVAKENQHCSVCNVCTTKDGPTYVHCMNCCRCVKPSWFHCTHCDRCVHPEHSCKKRNNSVNTSQNVLVVDRKRKKKNLNWMTRKKRQC